MFAITDTDSDFATIAEDEADLNWKTRELLDSICASVENVVADFGTDVMEFGGMILDD